MSGEDLYQLYTRANEEQNCSVDAWSDMSDSDQLVWNRMAELLPYAISAERKEAQS